MDRRLMLASLLIFVALGAAQAAAAVVDKAEQAARIETECRLKKGTITVTGDDISLQPSPDEAYENVDCALERLKKAGHGGLGFVGNQADPNAVVKPPFRYIAQGSNAQIAALVKAAEADKWTITRTATASDSTAILQFESGAAMTHGQAGRLLDRIWKKEFGDIELGKAPERLSYTGSDFD